MRLRVEEEKKKAKEQLKKQELKAMIQEIQEEVQTKVTGQVVTMLKTFLGDVGLLLSHLLKRGTSEEPYTERTRETARAIQVLHNFDLEDCDSDSDSDSDSESEADSEQSMSSDERNTKGRNRRMSPQNSNVCQCGKAVRQHQRGRECIIC